MFGDSILVYIGPSSLWVSDTQHIVSSQWELRDNTLTAQDIFDSPFHLLQCRSDMAARMTEWHQPMNQPTKTFHSFNWRQTGQENEITLPSFIRFWSSQFTLFRFSLSLCSNIVSLFASRHRNFQIVAYFRINGNDDKVIMWKWQRSKGGWQAHSFCH